MFRVEVDIRGTVLEGRAPAVMRAFLEDAVQTVADQGRDDVVNQLKAVIRHPTPYYWTRVHTERAGSTAVVTDGGVIYGPWLEGVGSRNKTTRFKGYHSFRLVTQRLAGRAHGIAVRVLRRHIGRLG